MLTREKVTYKSPLDFSIDTAVPGAKKYINAKQLAKIFKSATCCLNLPYNSEIRLLVPDDIENVNYTVCVVHKIYVVCVVEHQF